MKLAEPDQYTDMLERAEQAAVGAQRLTSQLLAFAKGGKPLQRSADVGALLREAVQLAGSGSHLRIEVDVPEDLWRAAVDSGQFSQVISNLVINAQQATGEGGYLLVRASNSHGDSAKTAAQDDSRYVRIDVEDNGAGIPEEIRDRVFDPYFTTKDGGSGLGLASAFAICRNHGGTLTFESRPGKGSTFSAFFPAAGSVRSESGFSAAEAPDGEGSILVLDDEPLVQDVIRLTLEQWGFEVVTVADGQTAVQRYLERMKGGNQFDLLIMDLTIPGGMGGRQAMAEILKHDPSARGIVASGYSDDPTMAHFGEAGFLAALAKPFQRSELARVVNAVIGGAAAGTKPANGNLETDIS